MNESYHKTKFEIQHINYGGPQYTPQNGITLFHGTSKANFINILQNGFKPSEKGCCGPGVYLARRDKAEKFAQSNGIGNGIVIVVEIKVKNPKFTSYNKNGYNDQQWIKDGHDSCRLDRTNFSSNMEWVIKDPSLIKIVGHYAV